MINHYHETYFISPPEGSVDEFKEDTKSLFKGMFVSETKHYSLSEPRGCDHGIYSRRLDFYKSQGLCADDKDASLKAASDAGGCMADVDKVLLHVCKDIDHPVHDRKGLEKLLLTKARMINGMLDSRLCPASVEKPHEPGTYALINMMFGVGGDVIIPDLHRDSWTYDESWVVEPDMHIDRDEENFKGYAEEKLQGVFPAGIISQIRILTCSGIKGATKEEFDDAVNVFRQIYPDDEDKALQGAADSIGGRIVRSCKMVVSASEGLRAKIDSGLDALEAGSQISASLRSFLNEKLTQYSPEDFNFSDSYSLFGFRVRRQ